MKILVTPLDWGLGHATRMVPLIRRLVADGHEVVLAGSGESLRLLEMEFPTLSSVKFRSFSPRFSNRVGVATSILMQIPSFLWACVRERRETERLVRMLDIDCIISDNRYGVHSKRCKSYFVTHQLTPRSGVAMLQRFEPLLACLLSRFINKYDGCLIPDVKPYPHGLSGELSNPRYVKVPIHYVGALSRMTKEESADDNNPIDWLCIVSGQEPHRTAMERDMLRLLREKKGRRVLVCGRVTDQTKPNEQHGINVYPFATAKELSCLIRNARNIVSRSGYSTIMDLYVMRKNAILLPTPGQAEQEYLSLYIAKKAYLCRWSSNSLPDNELSMVMSELFGTGRMNDKE